MLSYLSESRFWRAKRVTVLILIILIGLAGIWLGLRFIIGKSPIEPVACTMDVKLCPDGSYVVRIPPGCNFAPCSKTKTIKLYYYNLELDKDESGNIACSRNGLVPVEREIPITKTPIQDATKLLLSSIPDLEGVLLKGASLKDGILTLEFDDQNNKTVGGACRVGILWFQIEATAKQFPEVRQVRFLPEELFQP